MEKTCNTFIHKSTNVVEKLKEKQFKVKEEEEEDDKNKQTAPESVYILQVEAEDVYYSRECGVQGHTDWRLSWVFLGTFGATWAAARLKLSDI